MSLAYRTMRAIRNERCVNDGSIVSPIILPPCLRDVNESVLENPRISIIGDHNTCLQIRGSPEEARSANELCVQIISLKEESVHKSFEYSEFRRERRERSRSRLA